MDKKIRGLEEYMGYYLSSGKSPLEIPPHDDKAEPGDVFLHTYQEDQRQIWMRTPDGAWKHIQPGHDHPYLSGYCLLLKDGKPAWVT